MTTRRKRKPYNSLSPKVSREDQFEYALRDAGIGGWIREHTFHPTRRWRFDFAWTQAFGWVTNSADASLKAIRLAVEVEGITRFGRRMEPCKKCGTLNAGAPFLGAHQTNKGVQEDCEKYLEAMRLGWVVLRITQQMIGDKAVTDVIRQYVGAGGPMPVRQPHIELEESSPF